MTIHRALNFALAILLAPVLVSGQDQRKSPDQKMGPPARLVFAEGKARHEAHRSFQRAAAQQAQAGKDRQPYEIWFIEFDTAEACRQCATPNPKWGHGKLDLKAVAKIFQKL